MTNPTVPVNVRIIDKEFAIACPADERDELMASARFLDAKMREIRDSRKVIGTDRIAVICALNLAHELLQARSRKNSGGEAIAARVKLLNDRIESALQKSGDLEL